MKIVDMHCDTISELWKIHKEQGISGGLLLRENNGHIDLKRLIESGYLLQNFALFVNKGKEEDPWSKVQKLIEFYEKAMEQNSDRIGKVLTFSDIEKNEREGKLSSLLTVEEGAVCQGELSKLEKLYEQGVRMMTLTWNYPNELGYPNIDSMRGKLLKEEKADASRMLAHLNTADILHGLTDRGLQFLGRMEELGMIIDVSHLSDAGFYDVLHHTKQPFVASHSNARAICPCARNMTDEMIKLLAERGGVIGLNFCADFLTQLPVGVHNPGTIADIVRHARHICQAGGIECLGLGSDFDGIDTHEELPGAQSMELLYEALHRGGFKEEQIEHIFYKNILRVYADVLK